MSSLALAAANFRPSHNDRDSMGTKKARADLKNNNNRRGQDSNFKRGNNNRRKKHWQKNQTITRIERKVSE